jgi:hypothetical protein
MRCISIFALSRLSSLYNQYIFPTMAGTIEITIKHWSGKLPSAMFSRTLFLLNSSPPAMILASNVITSPNNREEKARNANLALCVVLVELLPWNFTKVDVATRDLARGWPSTVSTRIRSTPPVRLALENYRIRQEIRKYKRHIILNFRFKRVSYPVRRANLIGGVPLIRVGTVLT